MWLCRRSAIGWSLFALLHLGLGCVLHAWLPAEPRWTLNGSIELCGLASDGELSDIAAAWRAWAAHPDGWFAVLHGEIVCR